MPKNEVDIIHNITTTIIIISSSSSCKQKTSLLHIGAHQVVALS